MKLLCADEFWDKVYDYVQRKECENMDAADYLVLIREGIRLNGGAVVIGV